MWKGCEGKEYDAQVSYWCKQKCKSYGVAFCCAHKYLDAHNHKLAVGMRFSRFEGDEALERRCHQVLFIMSSTTMI
ncbi:hypothetical protein MRB53_016122 [Persea americana]|uniref:Uncharacterized protein n=1 Tax=Persea americana TaxID=3435 RepID=A0ACC2M1A0_PERAE|nr:hypothetical protein MRB53_016122 [Persea americana]